MRKFTNDEIFELSKVLGQKIKEKGIDPERTLILAPARGGLIPSGYISYMLGVRNVETVEAKTYLDKVQQSGADQKFGIQRQNFAAFDTILIIDDIFDTGNTFSQINNLIKKKTTHCDVYKCCLITQKDESGLIYATHGSGEWIEFPWDILEKED